MDTKGTEPIVCMTEVQTIWNSVSLGTLVFTVMFSLWQTLLIILCQNISGKKCDLYCIEQDLTQKTLKWRIPPLHIKVTAIKWYWYHDCSVCLSGRSQLNSYRYLPEPEHIIIIPSFCRIYLRYHTLHQVCYGFLLGSAIGVAWFMFTQTVFTPLFPTITTW